MGFLDRLLGREPAQGGERGERGGAFGAPTGYGASPGGYGAGYAGADGPQDVPGAAPPTADERAIERYRYLLATAPPEAVEQAHAEAFAQLTPDQRRQVLQQLAQHVPPSERLGDDPAGLARMATRTEMRRPGTLERTFGGAPAAPGQGGYGGPGLGAVVGGSLLGTVAGVVVGSAIANAMFGPAFGDLGNDGFSGDAADSAGGDPGADAGGDVGGGGDAGGGD
ncbi:hypothetical protein ICW40_09410, partial [Actinotalea ferrariae]|uniref:hypothetical protein n=1 Tax=Actinotalea ferrariae TaxID=1386098 RepID=UPI001EB82F02